MAYRHPEERREIYRVPIGLFAAARACEAEAEALGIDPAFTLAEIRRDEARRNGDLRRFGELCALVDMMKTIEFSFGDALYVLCDDDEVADDEKQE